VLCLVVMSGSQALITALEQHKVKHVFGIPGGANLPIYDSLFDSDMHHILARHEQIAAHMADGYARASGKAGVCIATSGPGATNFVTGLATAYADSSAVIAITGQVPKAMIGRDAFQETDILGVVAPITKYALQPLKAEDIPKAVAKAFYIATTGRPGPVLLDIPKDVQQEMADIEFPERVDVEGYCAEHPIDELEIKRATEILLNAKKPVLLGGGGVRISGAFQAFRAIAELLMAPVVTTLQGKGVFPEDHPLSLGAIGMHGRAEANRVVAECDALLAVGVRFSDRTTGVFSEFCKDAKIIHIDTDPSEFNKNKLVDVHILGDANKALTLLYQSLVQRISQNPENPWLKRVNEIRESLRNIPAYSEIPQELSGPNIVKRMREVLPRNAILTTGVGRHQMWCEIHYKVLEPRTWITSTGLGTMGFGLPAAIGAKLARPEVPVVDFDGDGSFVMTESALATAVEEGIPVISVILNDGSLGMVEQWQRLMYNRRYIGVKLRRNPDFVKLAEAYGAEGIRVDSLDEFEKALRSALKNDFPTVIEVPVSSEHDVFPFMPPGKTLGETLYGPKKEASIF
jgi:acetolactate synthase-1/2/3 large subunit